ncbi:Homeobox protein KNOX3 [Hordeum vulgare]|nr:Homeobox protein KNOX3 [Hordeum vulgare]
MVEPYPSNSAAANGFGSRHLREDEARLLYEADYSVPLDMRVPGSWTLSAGGVLVPPPPTEAKRRVEIARIRSGLPESSHNLPRYAPNSKALWTAYFGRHHADQLITTNRVGPHGCHNSEGRCQWCGIPGCTFEVVLEHIEGGNTPRYNYPPPPNFSRRRDSTWTPRRMETVTSSSFRGSSSCPRYAGLLALFPVKPEPQETLLGRHTHNTNIVINEPGSSTRLVRTKSEPGLLPVKQEHLAMAAADEATLKWGAGRLRPGGDREPASKKHVVGWKTDERKKHVVSWKTDER